MFSIINFFIAIYLSIVAIIILKAYWECLRIRKDKTQNHKIEIVIPLPHHILIDFAEMIKSYIGK